MLINIEGSNGERHCFDHRDVVISCYSGYIIFRGRGFKIRLKGDNSAATRRDYEECCRKLSIGDGFVITNYSVYSTFSEE